MKKQVVKRVLAVALAGAMVAGLAACGNSSAPAADETAPADDAAASTSAEAEAPAGDAAASSDLRAYEGATIEFQQWWDVELPEGYMQALCDDFYDATGITVELLSAPWADTKTALTSGAATGTIADVVSVDSAWLTDFADQGAITDLTALMEANGFDTTLLADQWQVDGTTYALPLLNFGYPLYVNMDILEAAGVESIPTDWDEMLEACKKITDAGYQAFPINLGTQNPNGICNVVMGMASATGIKMADGFVGNADMQAYLEYLKALWDQGSIASGAESLEESEMTSNFTAGNYAFVIGSMSMLSDYVDAGINVECAPIPVQPGYTGDKGMCVASWAVGIAENSENKEAALLWVQYLFGGLDGTDGTICADMAVQKSAFPSSTIADPDYAGALPQFETVYGIYKDGYPENQFIGIPQTATVEENMTNVLIQYLHGDIDIDETLTQMDACLQ